jgi:hypothetical protein
MAAEMGITRQISNLMKGRPDAFGCAPNVGWQVHIEGCCGELAVAKYLNRYWSGNFEQLKADDVGDYQVRTADDHNKRLILHDTDPDDRIFILITGLAPHYIIQGWVMAKEGKKSEFWSDPSRQGRPAYFVPRDCLNPIADLTPR